MLQPDFETQNKNDNKKYRNKQASVRVEYSGGFRQLSQSHLQRSKMREEKKQNIQPGNHILDYLEHVNIENLPSLYLSSMPDNSAQILQRQKQKQQQSVVRLFNNDYPTRRKREQQQTKEEADKTDKKYASDIWSLDSKYSQVPNQFAFRREILKMDKKMKVEYEGALKKRKIEMQTNCNQIFCCFLVSEHDKILEKLKNSKNPNTTQLEICYMWKGFLSTINFKTLKQKLEKQKICYQKIQRLRTKSKYLYCLIRLPKLKQEQVPITNYQLLQLCSFINKDFNFDMQEIKAMFQIQKQYTNPFYIQHQKKAKIKKQNNLKQESDSDQALVPFKANPIPKSTYQQPKVKDKKQHKSISVKPFKLSQKTQNMTPEEFYQFEKGRDFKAQPVPETTYSPFKPNLLSEQEKKARAIMTLQKSKFPQTMKNLEKYHEFKNNKIQKLAHKYEKSPKKIQIRQIPNFNHLHAVELTNLQSRKQQNNKNIKTIPFNLSVGKTRQNEAEQIGHFGVPNIHPYSPPKPAKAAKSTKKFDTYVKFRNEYIKQKNNKEKQEKKKKEEEGKQKQPYIKIIKERMAQQLEKHPKKNSQYDASQPMKIKVDMKKIYQEKPLLMTSSLPAQQYNLDWDPIF